MPRTLTVLRAPGDPPDTTVTFFAREDGRAKVSAQLAKAVEKAGGSVAVERTLKAKELPKWLQGLPPDQLLFPKLGKRRTWFMVKKDLERAGIAYETPEGIADPKKVAVMGGSYGGYATLAGVTFTPSFNSNSSFTIATSVTDGVASPITGNKAIATA